MPGLEKPISIRRKPVFDATEWDEYPQDTFDYMGSHAMNMPVLAKEDALGIDRALLDVNQEVFAATDITLLEVHWLNIT